MRSKQDMRPVTAASKPDDKLRQHDTDRFYLHRALELAWLAAGQTKPNPLVGAVVVNGGEVVGEGFHERSGRAHAEVIALEKAGRRSRDGTLYVTLEPCSHQGKTPPCADRVIASGIRRVVACTFDPDARVSGRGIRKLRENNIEVCVGMLQDQAFLLNLAYFKKRLSPGSAVTMKTAVTIDGKIASAPGRRDMITGEDAQLYVHRLRAENDAVVVGIDTLLTDRPILDCRKLPGSIPPVPVILDSRLRFPLDYPWIGEERRFIVCCADDAAEDKIPPLDGAGGKVIRCRRAEGILDASDVVTGLAQAGLSGLLVEGGGKIVTSFLEQNCWDALHILISSKLFGEGGVTMFRKREGFENAGAVAVDAQRLGNDFLLRYINRATRDEFIEKLNLLEHQGSRQEDDPISGLPA